MLEVRCQRKGRERETPLPWDAGTQTQTCDTRRLRTTRWQGSHSMSSQGTKHPASEISAAGTARGQYRRYRYTDINCIQMLPVYRRYLYTLTRSKKKKNTQTLQSQHLGANNSWKGKEQMIPKPTSSWQLVSFPSHVGDLPWCSSLTGQMRRL